MPRLAALVVTYNRLDQLKLTVARFLEAAPDVLEMLMVVDNASTDGTGDWLAAQHDPRLRVLRLDRNTGGAGGFSAGMVALQETCDPDWMLLTDDDGRPDPGALEVFHTLDLTGWDALAAAVYFPSGEICEMNRPSRNPFWAGRTFWRTARRGRSGFHLKSDEYAGDEIAPIDVTSFVGFFVRREGVAMAGVPDPGLFLYGDDGIYTLRLSAMGGRIGFAPQITFTHDMSTFAGQRGRFRPLWKVYYYHRNLLMLYRLAAGVWFWPVLLIILPKWALKIRHHGGERRAFWRLMRRAMADGLRRRTDVPHEKVVAWASSRD